MAETEKVDKRPACDWPLEYNVTNGTTKRCGSEERIYNVTRRVYPPPAPPTDTPICEKHLPDAIREWHFESAAPIDIAHR